MRRPDVFILARSKKKKVYSATLERELLARGVDVCRVTANCTPKYRPERVHTIINYGTGTYPSWGDRLPNNVMWYNHPDAVRISANKWATTQWFQDNDLDHLQLEWTRDWREADHWLRDGHAVVVRHLLGGHSGRGVQLIFPGDRGPSVRRRRNGLLFTKLYRPVNRGEHVREYRFYIVDGVCVDMAEKRRYSKDRREMAGIPNNNYTKYVRTNKNGWVYARNTISLRHDDSWSMANTAIDIARRMGIDFGGIDMIARLGPKDEEGMRELLDYKVVEPNTAIGFADSNSLRVMCDTLSHSIQLGAAA